MGKEKCAVISFPTQLPSTRQDNVDKHDDICAGSGDVLKTNLMAPTPDPHELRDALQAVHPWLIDADQAPPPRSAIAHAVRLSVTYLSHLAPGHAVEVRVPPSPPPNVLPALDNTRGTPPNVVETDPATWLRLVTGLDTITDNPAVTSSGTRAGEVADWLPLVRL